MRSLKKEISNFHNAKRKAETRTKIQLGGLVLKSKITEILGISAGDELELDLQKREKALIVLGALIDCQKRLEEDEEVLREWDYLARDCLSRNN